MIPLPDWRRAGAAFTFDGHEVFTRTGGRPDAEPLLLIHGFPTASWDWEAVWEPLCERHRVLTLDMLGFGFSAKPRGHAYTIAEQADLCEAFLREQRVVRYHVLAHDYGDTVAQELLARQGESRGPAPSLQSVAFLNGGLFPETHRPLLAQKLLLSPLGPFVARRFTKDRMAAAMTRIFGPRTPPSGETIEAFWQLLLHNDGRAAMPRLIRYMVERRQHRERWVGALQTTRIPLKLIDGAADPISGAHMAERYRELVPRADVTLLEGIGHYPQVEAPQQVLDAYRAFR